jgi:hypothetical protein
VAGTGTAIRANRTGAGWGSGVGLGSASGLKCYHPAVLVRGASPENHKRMSIGTIPALVATKLSSRASPRIGSFP